MNMRAPAIRLQVSKQSNTNPHHTVYPSFEHTDYRTTLTGFAFRIAVGLYAKRDSDQIVVIITILKHVFGSTL